MVEVLEGGQYKLGCSSGILDIHYYAADLESVVAEFPDLLTSPETAVSALRSQNAVGVVISVNARLIAPHEAEIK